MRTAYRPNWQQSGMNMISLQLWWASRFVAHLAVKDGPRCFCWQSGTTSAVRNSGPAVSMYCVLTLPTKYQHCMLIQDINGPATLWLREVRGYFWAPHLNQGQRVWLLTFTRGLRDSIAKPITIDATYVDASRVGRPNRGSFSSSCTISTSVGGIAYIVLECL
jgi:hypothetical protein